MINLKTSLVRSFVVAAALAVSAVAAQANTIRAGFDSNTLAANDDGYTSAVNIGFNVNFFGATYSQLFVNNNGNVTFNAASGTYIPFSVNGSTSEPIIAGFLSDIDTRYAGSPVTYGSGTADGHAAFAANYLNVGEYGAGESSALNSFQIVLIDRSDTGVGNFDIELNYANIDWDHGGATVGYSNSTGDAGTFYQLLGSMVSGAFLDGGTNSLVAGSNIGTAGRYLFSARNGSVEPLPSVPLPASLPLMLVGLGGFAALRRKRR